MTQNRDLERVFLDALHEGDLDGVRRCLNAGMPSTWQDVDGCSALFYALHRRHWTIAETLLAHGADINAPDAKGWTPLFWAAFSGHTDVVSFLVDHHADPNVKTAEGEWALLWSIPEGHADIVRLLLNGGARRDWIRADQRDVLQLSRIFQHHDIEELLVATLRP